MNNQERLQLDKLLKQGDVTDNTSLMRSLKHSGKIYEDVNNMLNLKKTHKQILENDPDTFSNICTTQCSFLFNNYCQFCFNLIYNVIYMLATSKRINTIYK